MSYNTELDSNNTDLQGILESVNALEPSTEASYTECKVQIKVESGTIKEYFYTQVSSDGISTCHEDVSSLGLSTITLGDVLCGSVVMFTSSDNISSHSVSGMEELSFITGTTTVFAAKAPTSTTGTTFTMTMSSVTLIEFSASVYGPYTAEEGMTWREWVASDYNTYGYQVCNSCGMVWYDNDTAIFDDSDNMTEYVADLEIIAGHQYMHYTATSTACGSCPI